MWVPSLGWEDPLEKKRATHSGILAWRIPWTEEPKAHRLPLCPHLFNKESGLLPMPLLVLSELWLF